MGERTQALSGSIERALSRCLKRPTHLTHIFHIFFTNSDERRGLILDPIWR